MNNAGSPIIKWIEYHLPEKTLNNEELSSLYPAWSPEKIKKKTGIISRHIASSEVCASDLAYEAAIKLFDKKICQKEEIDFLLFCTQTPDYFLPASACILQDRLGLSRQCGALDLNLGCSGYVYGLGIAKGLIESKQANNVLLLTGDTYSKFLDPHDIGKRTIFGDGASATLVVQQSNSKECFGYIGSPIFGTDGSGANNLIVKSGGMRSPNDNSSLNNKFLYINNEEVLLFIEKNVPQLVEKVLEKANLAKENIDIFIFHQANKYILDLLKEKINLPDTKVYLALENFGNTVSSTIPIALRSAFDEKKITGKETVMIVGFGVGYSWAGTVIKPADERSM